MDPFDAVRAAADDYESPRQLDDRGLPARGRSALARDLGDQPGSFLNRLNDELPTHPLRVKDLLRVMTATGDARIAQSLARMAGGVFVALPDPVFSDKALLELWTDKAKEDGDFARCVGAYLRLGHLTPEDFCDLEREALESISALLALVMRMKQMVRSRQVVR